MTSTIVLTNTDTNPNYDYVFELTGPSTYVLNNGDPIIIPDDIEIILKIKDTSGNIVETYNLNSMGVLLYFYQNAGMEKTLGDIESGNIVSGDILNINFQDLSIDPDYGGFFTPLGNFFLADNDFNVQITFSDIPSGSSPSVANGSIVFDMEGILYNDLEALNQTTPEEVSSIVQNALLSIFNISNITIQSLLFNSIDVNFTATGNFDATNFQIYESDNEPVVNAFVFAANNADLGPYTMNDLTLTAVDSRGQITDSEGNVISYTCFAAGSMVETDQGEIAIEKINKNKHTINGKKIVSLTKNILGSNEIVCINKNALGENKPSQETLVSPNHLISHQGEMKEAKWIAENVEGASFVPYKNQTLYNIVMEKYDVMKVNNMVTETLHPDNIVAKLHKNDNFLERKKLIKEFNESVKQNGYNTAKRMFKKKL